MINSLFNFFLICLFFLFTTGCNSEKYSDKQVVRKGDLLLVMEKDSITNLKTIDYFDGKNHLLLKARFAEPIEMCDTNKAFRNEINSHPNEILFFDEQDSLVAKDVCVKIGEGIDDGNGKRFIYDCVRIEFDLKHRIRVDGLPKESKKTVKRAIKLKIERDCNGIIRIPVSESKYDYDKANVERLVYNQNGKIESISFYTYPHEKIFEKKLFVDGEYIKTKCFANDSLKIVTREFFNENQSCFD